MNLALFDFDGTITTREMFAEFIHFAAPPRRLRWGRVLLAPLVAGYKLGIVPANTLRAMAVRCAFAGVNLADAQRAGKRFADEVLVTVIRPEALERIQWHKSRGDTVVVVSGALDLYLWHWCEQHGIGLICSQLETQDGALTGRYQGRQCVRAEKSRRVLASCDLRDFPVVYAYGDTSEDLDLLALAGRKFYRGQEVV